MLQTNQLHEMNADILATLGLRQKVQVSGKTSRARLLGLSSQLSSWNTLRNSAQSSSAQNSKVQPKDLSIEDVHFLKEIIHAEIKKTAVKHPDVVSDQILFLVIGAIQIQSQNHSNDAWKLVDQSIQNFLKPEKDKRTLLFGFTAIALTIICVSATMLLSPKLNSSANDLVLGESPSTVTTGTTDPVTISLLLLIYNKMKDGTCQLPQAAMLPPEQRQAFLSFINEGKVDVRNVANLKLALGYVNCLYPQELMHPTP